jgi:hypothetical protein
LKLKVRKVTTDTGSTNADVMASTIYPAITSRNDSSSDDEGKTKKITIMKLCRHNWTEWKKYFMNLLVGQGHEGIFDVDWCKEHANEKIFWKKSALAFTLLHLCLSTNLKPIAAASETFTEAMMVLAETCGEKSLIKLGNKLYALICCDFIPGTSIAAHVAKLHSLYTSLKSTEAHRGHKSAHAFCKMKKQKSKIHLLYFKIHIFKLVFFSSPMFVKLQYTKHKAINILRLL